MLGRLKRFGVPVEDLVSVYVGYVRPSVEYASPVWHGCIIKQQTHQIERIQKRACHVILGNNYTTHTDALDLMGLQTLEDRRDQLCTNFAVVPLIDMPVGSLITTTLTVWVFAMLLNIRCLNIGLSVMATVQFHSLLNFQTNPLRLELPYLLLFYWCACGL